MPFSLPSTAVNLASTPSAHRCHEFPCCCTWVTRVSVVGRGSCSSMKQISNVVMAGLLSLTYSTHRGRVQPASADSPVHPEVLLEIHELDPSSPCASPLRPAAFE